MKVIFLDIDGVLTIEQARDPYVFSGLLPEKMDLLNEIVEKTGARVVISSSWKKNTNVESLALTFRQNWFKGEVFDKTPDLPGMTPGGERGHEIQYWIYLHWPIESFVILDGGNDMAHLKDRLIQTESEIGLTRKHVDLAVALLRLPF